MVKLESSANIPTAAALSANALPAVTLRMRFFSMPSTAKTCSPAAGSSILAWIRIAVETARGVEGGGGGIGETLGFARRRCAFRSVRACARLVVFQLYPKSKLYSLHRSLARSLAPRSPSLSLSLPLPPSTDTHSSAAARSSFRAIASARCMTSGGEGMGGDLAWRLSLSRAFWTYGERCLHIQIKQKANTRGALWENEN